MKTDRNRFNNEGIHIFVKDDDDLVWIQDRIHSLTSNLPKSQELEGLSEYEGNRMWWYYRLKNRVKVISMEDVLKETQNGRLEMGCFEGWLDLWIQEQKESLT